LLVWLLLLLMLLLVLLFLADDSQTNILNIQVIFQRLLSWCFAAPGKATLSYFGLRGSSNKRPLPTEAKPILWTPPRGLPQ
jgi:hypothetical protein